MRAGLTLEHPTPLAPVERGCSARQSRSLERNAEEIRTGFAMLEAFSNDPERKRLHLRDSCLLALAIRQNARQLQHFGQPAAVVFPLSLNLERDQAFARLYSPRVALRKSSYRGLACYSDDHCGHGHQAAAASIHGKPQAFKAVRPKQRLRPLLAKEHQGGYRTAIHFQSDFPDFPPRPSAIGNLHGLLTNGRSL